MSSHNKLILNFFSLIIENEYKGKRNAYKCQYWNFLHLVSDTSFRRQVRNVVTSHKVADIIITLPKHSCPESLEQIVAFYNF